MPTYDYRCLKCKKKFEKFQSMTEKHLRTCPYCKKGKVERLIGGGAGIIFKGSGFYQTDYKKSSPAEKTKEKDADAGSCKSQAKGSSKKSPCDSCPAKKG